jgi:hypothetical protein
VTKKKIESDSQNIIIRRAEFGSYPWCVILPYQWSTQGHTYSGEKSVHAAHSKREALEWALEHLAGSGGHGENLASVKALEVGQIPFPEL